MEVGFHPLKCAVFIRFLEFVLDLLFITRIYNTIELINAYFCHVHLNFFCSNIISIGMQPLASKGIQYCQQTTINTIPLYIRENKI